MYSPLMSPLPLARWYVEQVVQRGDTVIDCTAGKGRDTLFLAQLVGDTGKVYAFDIQEEAIQKTQKLLKKNNLHTQVHCILSSHENLDQYICCHENISAVMFNLGYLPGGDHTIITRADSTIAALEKAVALLRPGGLVSVVAYTGHEGGSEENRALVKYLNDLNKEEYGVLVAEFLKITDQSPRLFVIEKCENKLTEVQE